jgi:subtilase family serine protease
VGRDGRGPVTFRDMIPARPRATAALLAAAALAAAATTALVPTALVTAASPSPVGAVATVRMQVGLQRMGRVTATPPTLARCRRDYGISCYGAKQIEQAYDLPGLYRKGITGKGQTIVIVDSFGSPTIKHDLAVFDKAYQLPAPPSLKIIAPAGMIPAYKPTGTRAGWAGETTLDVEYAHAIAPGAKLLLVETPVSEEEGTTGFPQIVKAEKYVLAHHLGGVISQSFSATEQTFPTTKSLLDLRGAYTEAARDHVTVLAASGDSGAADVEANESDYYLHPVTSWPDSDPLVTAVGGTKLSLNSAGKRTSADRVWNDTYDKATLEYLDGDTTPDPIATGGGRSVVFARPAFQNGVKALVGDHRGVPDISMSGSCSGAVTIYGSFKGEPAGWQPTCGTSEATPLFAGIVALADQQAHRWLGDLNPTLYAMSAHHAKGLVDVTHGDTTVSFTQDGAQHTVSGAKARPGYDLASGVGTVDALRFVPALATAAR